MKHRLLSPLRPVHPVGVLRESGQVDHAEIRTAGRPAVRRRLPEVVETGPDKEAGHVVPVADRRPRIRVEVAPRHPAGVVGRQLVRSVLDRLPPDARLDPDRVGRLEIDAAAVDRRSRLRSDHRLAGIPFPEIVIIACMIVESENVQRAAADQVVRRSDVVVAGGHAARRVQRLDGCDEFAGQRDGRIVVRLVRIAALLRNLVADAPEDDARVVAVAPDEIRQVRLVPRVEEARIVIPRLRLPPHVEGLVHHEDAHRVAEVQQLRRRGIVRRADGVQAHFLQDCELALERPAVDRGAEGAHVVVEACAQQLDVPPVEEEALVGVPGNRADAELLAVAVDHTAVGDELRDQRVLVGIIDVPAVRTGDFQVGARPRGDFPPARVEDPVAHRLAGAGALQLRGDPDHGLRVADFRRRDIEAAVGEMRLRRSDEPHVAVDAAARVPAGIRLLGVVAAHGDHVVFARRRDKRRDVIAERAVAVRPCPDFVAVDIDRAVHKDAVELHGDPVCVRRREVLAVPADAARQRAAARRRRVVGGEFALDAPVVGQVQLPPGRVVESGLRPRRVVAEAEPPVEVEILHQPRRPALPSASCRQHHRRHQQASQ